MKTLIRSKISKISNYVEIYISIIIIIGILISSLDLFAEIFDVLKDLGNTSVHEKFSVFLGDALKLVIGIEFIKMLIEHTPESVVKVLLFAIARKIIIEASTSVDIIVGVIAITILLGLLKYFSTSENKNVF